MAGTTPIYGFPYPESSDLVADYPALGQDLAEDVETVIAALPPGGLAHIATESFSAVSSVSLNGCFTSAYENYRIILPFSGGSSNLTMRLRVSGTDSSASYFFRGFNVSDSSSGASNANNAAQWTLSSITDAACVTLDLLKPQIAQKTTLTGFSVGAFSASSASGNYFVGGHYVDTSYDGFTFFGTSMSGSIRVYGYANS